MGDRSPRSKSYVAVLLKSAVIIALLALANFAWHWFSESSLFEIDPSNEEAVRQAIMMSAALYSILLAIPFVPGVELAVGLILMFGPDVVWLIYGCTLLGLTLSFAVGSLVPIAVLIRMLEFVRLRRAAVLMGNLAPMKRSERLQFLLAQAPNRYVPFLLKHRYIALAVVINLPGNFLIGGGGGIAMIAGLSRLFSVWGFVATVAIAVLPVPLAVYLFGNQILGS
ncbi:MAG: hypothetical protein ACR2OV_10865 [Hyphomicrobiaceae bacterium]